MHIPRSFAGLVALALACCLAFTGAAARAQSTPTLLTDRDDYLPGDTVILVGYGFQPGETVDISIAIDDDANNVHIGDYDWMVELADDTGDFTTFWTVPLEAYGMTLRATALGLSSSAVATTIFHDSPTTTNVSFRVVGMSAVSPPDGFTLFLNGAPQPGFLMTDGTVFGPFAVPANTPVSYQGQSPEYNVTLCDRTPGRYTTPSIGFVTGAPGASTVVDIVYSFTPAIPPNAPPSISASDYSFMVCPEDGSATLTVTPALFAPITSDPDFDPVSVAFWDGVQLRSSLSLTFNATTTSYTITLRATDNPVARTVPPPINSRNCPIPPRFTDYTVTVSANIYQQRAPVVSANNIVLPAQCVTSSGITVPVSLGAFGASVTDPDGPIDNPQLNPLGVSSVTLALPPGVSDGFVSVPVTITATDNPSARDNGDCAPLTPMTGSFTAYVGAVLHTNNAPTINAHDVDLGDIVGCLCSGVFGTEVNISPAMFGAAATDPDGDPVAVTASVSRVTLVGPGVASAVVTLTATDNPAYRTSGVCAPASATRQVRVSARLVYRFQGVLSPLNPCASTKVKRGSNVPVKFRLYDCNNREIRTGDHTIAVALNQANAPDGAVDVDEPGGCDDDNVNFHYTGGQWLFNLKTNSSYHLNTTYVIRIYTDDGVVHTAMISIKP
jgi:hypothetical protein